MATTAVVGLAAGKSLVFSSSSSRDNSEKFLAAHDHGVRHSLPAHPKGIFLDKRRRSVRSLRDDLDCKGTTESWIEDETDLMEGAMDVLDGFLDTQLGFLDAQLMLQKWMLEEQWNLTCDPMAWMDDCDDDREGPSRVKVVRSGLSARERRSNARREWDDSGSSTADLWGRRRFSIDSVLPSRGRSLSRYRRGWSTEQLLNHTEVLRLSKIFKAGLLLEACRGRLKEILGHEPSDNLLASSLRISHAELRKKLIESSFAREILTKSNVRLVIAVAQKYENMGVEMADLIQGGLVGLLRGIEKFDSSKGFRISTYVYWWIRRGVSKTLYQNCRMLRLPSYLHERLFSIRTAKTKLLTKGIVPSIEKIAEVLNISQNKVRNATEADRKVLSFDSERFPSESFHSYIADNHLANNPQKIFEEWCLKNEVHRLLDSTLTEREIEVICLYYGLRDKSHTWTEIGNKLGLSRERVRQVGRVAVDKLKHAAREKRLEFMLIKH